MFPKLRGDSTQLKTPRLGWMERGQGRESFEKDTLESNQKIFGYVSEDRGEYDGLVDKHDHIIFSDRENVQDMEPIPGSSLFHEVIATGETSMDGDKTLYQLIVAQKPCRCLFCRGKDPGGTCLLYHWKEPEMLQVRPRVASDIPEPRIPIPRELEEEVCKFLGIEKTTIKILSNYLKANSLRTTGRKLELLNRVKAHAIALMDTRQGNSSEVESIVLASEAGVHHEDDLDPDLDEEEESRDQSC